MGRLRVRVHNSDRETYRTGSADPHVPQPGHRIRAAPVTLHGLRHGAATLALAAGTDLKIVQDQLGHSTITLTADTYTSVLPETARAAADSTAALLFPASARHAAREQPGSRRAGSQPVPARARHCRGQHIPQPPDHANADRER
jgi:hypothetical protein